MMTSQEDGERPEVEYGLRVHVLGKTPFLAIDQTEYQDLKASRDLVRDALGLEEAFHRLLGNYLEWESTLLEEALRFLVFTEGSWSEFVGTIHECNRRLANLLSGARAYLDQTGHMVSGLHGNPSTELQELKKWKAREYDARLGYRVMEALRNYSQHRGLAVHHLSHQHWAEERDGSRVLKNGITPSVSPSRLREDGGFKSAVLAELEALGEDTIDLRPLVREYMEGLATVQTKLRGQLKEKLEAADAAIIGAIDRYRREGQEDVLGLAAVKKQQGRKYSESVSLFEDLIERRVELERRSRRLTNITGHYTTNEPKPS